MRAALALLLAATPALADGPRPAPDYFVATAMDLATANALAVSCPRVSINPGAANARSSDTMARLLSDGFDPETLATDMADPAEAFDALRTAFMDKHALVEGAPEDAVCAAGLAEIAEETGIGALLLEVPQ